MPIMVLACDLCPKKAEYVESVQFGDSCWLENAWNSDILWRIASVAGCEKTQHMSLLIPTGNLSVYICIKRAYIYILLVETHASTQTLN